MAPASQGMLRFHEINRYEPGQIVVKWVDSALKTEGAVTAAIEAAWAEAAARRGVLLFDGPMCRLERMAPRGEELELCLSRTGYKVFFGTNLSNPALFERFGDGVMGNALGASCVLQSADGWLLLGRRNDTVAYYPDRVHPFAGALEPSQELDVFAEARRELCEETGLTSDEIIALCCLGLVEDVSLLQPELIFAARTSRTREQMRAGMPIVEHGGLYAVSAASRALEQSIADAILTPVARAALALWGKSNLGDAWFGAVATSLSAPRLERFSG
jgi:8-oxo-dGTP pyrophosphatase MutT (NUDIX family)